MKLLYITSSLPIGTQETFIIPELNALLAAGHEVIVVPVHPRGSFIHDDARPILSRSFVLPIRSPRLLAGISYLFLHPAPSLRAFRSLLTTRPSHLLKNIAAFFKALYLAKWGDLRSFEHIHAHWAATSSSLALALHHLSGGIPWSFTAHRWDILDNNLLARKIDSASFVRLISQSSLSLLKKHIPNPPLEKIHIIPMGVEIPPFITPPPRGKRRDSFTLLCPANLLPVKGHRYLIEAVRLLKASGTDIRLIIAGDGPLEKELRQQVAVDRLNDRIEFAGRIAHGKLLELYRYRAVDAVVLASVDLGNGVHEGIPVALIEAMAHGLPVISTTTGGIPELLHGGAGIMVPDKDPLSLANAIRDLLHNPERYREIAEKGRFTVEERFSVIVSAWNLLNLFTQYCPRNAFEKEK